MLIFSHSHATIFQYNHTIMSSYFHNFRVVLLCYHRAPVLSYHRITVSLHHRGIIIVSACSHIHILPYRYYHTAMHYDVIMLPSHLLCVHQRFPQSPHRLLKAAELLEAVISFRNLTPPFQSSSPAILQPSSHPRWDGGMRVAIEFAVPRRGAGVLDPARTPCRYRRACPSLPPRRAPEDRRTLPN